MVTRTPFIVRFIRILPVLHSSDNTKWNLSHFLFNFTEIINVF